MGFQRHLITLAALFTLIAVVFSNSFTTGMTLDNRYIIEEYYRTITHQNAQLELVSRQQMPVIFAHDYWSPKGVSGLYRPLTTLSYWLDYAVLNGKAPKHDSNFRPINDSSGQPIPASTYAAMSWKDYADAPGQLPVFSYHAINLLVHSINASLLYFLCLALFKRFWPAVAAAGLFATHPIVVESVTNIIGRADLFAGFTILAGLLIYIRSTVSRSAWRRTPWLIGLALIVGFGLFSKESAIAIGVIVPFYWFVFRCDWKRDGYWRRLGIEAAAWVVMLFPLTGMLVARHYVFANSTPAEEPFLDNPIRGIHSVRALGLEAFEQQLREHPVLGVSFIECKLTAVKVLGKLIALLAWPQTLCSDYSYSQIPNFSWRLSQWEDWKALIAIAFFAGVGRLAWKLRQRGNKAAVFWIGFFFLTALPTANLVYAIGSIMAERFMYVPLAGFAALFAIAGFSAADRLSDRFRRRATPIASTVFAIICCVYGARTFLRNRVWLNDETLWRDAIAHAPRSFRCYQSLAFALFERPDAFQYLDEMIQLDYAGRKLVDWLPDHLNSARLYLHLGMYLSIKGDSLLTHHADGTATLSDASRSLYEQAVETLGKGTRVDRAFDEQIRRRQELRGDPPESIADMGLGPIYGTLAVVQARLGHVQDALNSIQYQRQIDPAEVDSYRKETVICIDAHRPDQAATALIQALLIDNTQPTFWRTLTQIYSQMPGGENAVVQQDGGAHINLQNPLVRQHVIAAYSRFIRDFRRAHRPDLAKTAREGAIHQFGLPAGLVDPLMREPIEICTPDGIQNGVIDSTVKPLE